MARRRAIASELHHKARALAGTDDRRSMESGEFVERCEGMQNPNNLYLLPTLWVGDSPSFGG